jgi:hypothetical protein
VEDKLSTFIALASNFLLDYSAQKQQQQQQQ